MQQTINKEIGNSIHHDYKTDLRNGYEIISNPHNVMDRLIFFVQTVDNLLNLNKNNINVHTSLPKIYYCPNTMLVYPITENDVESITQSLKVIPQQA